MDHLNQSQQAAPQVALVAHPQQRANSRDLLNGSYGFEATEDDDSGSALMDYWRILVRNRGKISAASIAGLILGFAIGIPLKPVYRAQTSLEVLTLNEDFLNMKQANPTTTNDNSYDTSEEQTQAKLLQSSALLDRVVTKLDPNAVSKAGSRTRIATSGWRKIFHLSEPIPFTAREKLLIQAADSIKVHPAVRTRVLDVSVESVDPKLAMEFANALTQEFMAQSMEAHWNMTQRTSDWLRRELDEARDKLRRSEDSLQAYARSSGLIFTDDSTNVATERLQQLQQSLSTATTERISRQSRYELAQSSPPDSLADVLNDASLRELQTKGNDLKREIADLSIVFNPEYEKIQRLKAELESVQTAFLRSRSDILSRIKNDFQESTRKERLLAAAYSAQAQNVSGQDEKAIQYNILKRDVDSNRQLYDTMLQQMKQASIASAMRASNVRIVDPATLPSESVFPNFKLNSALGLLAGLILSAGIVSIRDQADRTLQQPGDIKLWLDAPELGSIPNAALDGKEVHSGLYPRLAKRSGNSIASRSDSVQENSTTDWKDTTVELVTFHRKPSLIAEAFRSVLTSVLFIGENGNRPRVVVFTSANAADGKTTVASNLAIAAAEIRCKVLVIDADLRRPRMHSIFGLPNDRGLSDVLKEDLDEKTVLSLVQDTRVPNLHVLPAGPATHAAAHLLYSPNFSTVLQRFRMQYDMILIDTPPILQITDARVVARLADSVILVARAGKTTRDALIAAKDRLEEDRTRILGTVLNDWDPKRARGGYYGSYGTYYQGQNAKYYSANG